MTGPTLAQSMREAWSQKAARASADLTATTTAPALFKPEESERAISEYEHAVRELGRWSA